MSSTFHSMERAPGYREVVAARRFFAALAERDAARLEALLADQPVFENVDGPSAREGRRPLAQKLARRAGDVSYQLAEVAATPGRALARFVLSVDDVPGAILLDAVLDFVDGRIASIVVRPPSARN